MLAAGAARDERQVERVILRIQANQQAPHGATADFDLVRLGIRMDLRAGLNVLADQPNALGGAAAFVERNVRSSFTDI